MLSKRTTCIAAGAIAVAAFQLFHLYGLHTSKDLPLWDESAYIGWGDEFLQDGKTGSMANAPFYHILYAWIISATGVVKSFYAMQYIMKTCISVFIFFVTLRFSKSIPLSLLTGLVFAYSEYHLNADVLVYYGGFAPTLLALVTFRKRPLLGLAFAFMASLGRLENLAIFFSGILAMALQGFLPKAFVEAESPLPLKRPNNWIPSALTWSLNIFVLSTISVWAMGNRAWYAWSQNFAYFRVATGKVTDLNPWLEHTAITEAEFPGVSTLSEAWSVNPTAIIEHTWFNLSSIPIHLTNYFSAPSQSIIGSKVFVVIFCLLIIIGIIAITINQSYRSKVITHLRSLQSELLLCIGCIVATTPAIIVTTRPRYISSLIPIAIFSAFTLFRPNALGPKTEKRLSILFLTGALLFVILSVFSPRIYQKIDSYELTPVRDNIERISDSLAGFSDLKFLGVSTVSYVNYLGREKNHQFAEIHAISPIVEEKADRSLKGLIEQTDPDVILVNDIWRLDPDFESSMATYSLEDWPQVPLRDGILYLKPGLKLAPTFKGKWYNWEQSKADQWMWSGGDSSIDLTNSLAGRKASFEFLVRVYGYRQLQVMYHGKALFDGTLKNGETINIGPIESELEIGRNTLSISSSDPAQKAPGRDPRNLSFSIINYAFTELDSDH